ncbi:MAG: transcriptional regulator [Anaerolineaceae bacterium]|nr:transcriptional regulator [Anaerolineaceae bacterium]
MNKRTYNQFCPLAYSLDVIGDRWTLLIVRELMFGPRRYTDLQQGLPGIGTNLLAKRLKDMEAADIISQQKLPPPAASHVYALTERGQSLQPIINQLAQWGKPYLAEGFQSDDYFSTVACMSALRMMFTPDNATGISVTINVARDNESFFVQVHRGVLAVQTGLAPQADADVNFDDLKSLLMLIGNPDVRQQTQASGMMTLSGDAAAFDSLLSAFTLPIVSSGH